LLSRTAISERGQDASQRRRISLKAVESSEGSLLEFSHVFEESVVVGFSPGFLPGVFGGMEFRRVRGQRVELNMVLLAFEPLSCFEALVIFGIVQDQMYLPISIIPGDDLVEKGQETVALSERAFAQGSSRNPTDSYAKKMSPRSLHELRDF